MDRRLALRAVRVRLGAPAIHGWVCDLRTGFIKALTGAIASNREIVDVCKFHQAATGAPA